MLPHRHHGGDRLRQSAQGVPAGPGHIMIGNRRSDRAKPEHPGGRVGKACGAKGIEAPVQVPNGHIPAVLTVRGPDRRCEWLPTVTPNVPMACPPRVLGHSMPIAKTAGGAV
jgi:hypothetical protein